MIDGPIHGKLEHELRDRRAEPVRTGQCHHRAILDVDGKNRTSGGVPGDTYQASQGNQLDYNSCVIAEDEKNSPWTPFYVQQGFQPEENVVSFFLGWGIHQGHGAKGAGAIGLRRTEKNIAVIRMTPESQTS